MKQLLSVCFFSLWFSLSYGQSFKAELLGGLNASQIDGDRYAGYNKVGLAAGLGVTYPLKDEKVKLGIQALYSQKGASTKTDDPNRFVQRLNYIDMPIYIDWNAYENLHLNAGVMPGYLVSEARDEGFGFYKNSELFKTFSFDFMLEAKYYFVANAAVGVRLTYAALSSRTTKGWYNNMLGFYLFFGLN